MSESGGKTGPSGGRAECPEDLAEAGAAFRFCPSCASPHLYTERGRQWRCPSCGFEYFHNVATAAGIIIEAAGKILLLVRAKDPSRGMYSLPGGFVEPGESAEDAAMRECREEIGYAPDRLEFLASYPNLYRYRGIPYATCDLFFLARTDRIDPDDFDCDEEESSGLIMVEADEIPWEMIAFDSVRRALGCYVGMKSRGIEAG